MTAEVFYEYIANLFHPYLVKHIANRTGGFISKFYRDITTGRCCCFCPVNSMAKNYSPGEVVSKLNIAPLLAKDANAVDYSKCLGSTTIINRDINANASTTTQEENSMNFTTFQTIVGNEILRKFENAKDIQDINELNFIIFGSISKN
ncbi:hypothetical protein NQ317_015305 [Molorchus minor]|uniref:Uncharacterized protein n=1 Tax=Molorchus minor TaxID=1323400 RepID=A0ABQ9JUL5_9CUCU|nr:hypothetical protein NQ317_015305 [Molorchus minor]